MSAEIFKVDGSGNTTSLGCGAHVFVQPPIPAEKRSAVIAGLTQKAQGENSQAGLYDVRHGARMSSVVVRNLHTGETGTVDTKHMNGVAFGAAQLMVEALRDAGLEAENTLRRP